MPSEVSVDKSGIKTQENSSEQAHTPTEKSKRFLGRMKERGVALWEALYYTNLGGQIFLAGKYAAEGNYEVGLLWGVTAGLTYLANHRFKNIEKNS